LTGQWSGNNVVSYFMPEMVKQAGITNPNTQLLINAINPIFSLLGSVYGASLLDKLGRRKMMLSSLCGCIAFYSLLTAFTAQTPNHPGLAYGVIVAIYLFGICFGWGKSFRWCFLSAPLASLFVLRLNIVTYCWNPLLNDICNYQVSRLSRLYWL
jgi:MFS family permease